MGRRRHPATLPALYLALFLAWPLTAADHSARRFGAIPNDARDDTRALQQAVDACQPGDRLVLEPGVYDLTSGITLAAKRDFEWVGQGAALVMRGYNRETDQGSFTLLTVRDCQNIRLRDFTVDQQPSRHLDGTVVASAEDHFDLQVFTEFLPITGRERIGIMMNYRPDGTPDGRHFNTEKHDGVELLRPDTLRIRTPLARHLKTGEGIVIRHNAYGPHVMSFDGCDGVTLSSVSLYAGGMGLAATRTANLTLDRFQINYRPGTQRLMSVNADGVHLNMCRGQITLTNCVLRGMGDDCINIHGMWARATALDSPARTVRLEAGTRHTRKGRIYPDWAKPGEQLEFYDRDLRSRGTATVDTVRQDGDELVVTLNPLPPTLAPGDLVENATCIPSVRVSGCTLGRNRARGFLCQVREALIENNTFEHTSSGGLWILTDAHYWFESGPARRVTVRGNTFRGCNRGETFREGAIVVFAENRGWMKYGVAGSMRGVTIEGNTIRDTDASAIFVASGEGITIRSNHIGNVSRNIGGFTESGPYAIYLQDTRDAVVAGNTFDGIRQPFGHTNCSQVISTANDAPNAQSLR